MMKSVNGTQKGFVLIMVLWILAVLTVMAISLTYMTRVESLAALSFRKSVAMKFLAEAGVERGVAEVLYRMRNLSIEGSEVWRVDGTPYEIETDHGNYSVGITDESGKVDINRTPELILRNLLGILGHDLEVVDTITDSVMDWKDADDFYRLSGAESDYYMSLPEPYAAKNADFETLEELMLVKGVTPEILHGEEDKKGLIDFLTVYSGTGRINLNAAPQEVLMAIPGMSQEIADDLIESRQAGVVVDLKGLLGENYSFMVPYINTGVSGSNTYTFETTGYLDPEETGYGIRAVVKLVGTKGFNYLYYKSPADIRHDRDDKS
jgi:general secretion pathway protein K